ncbi:hypothetical protein Leryth_012421 [Lithospermum erythrorhizon]|nr:hypothetical protein Leryth_012421 [Lithospermum erythrorhizon]
MQTTNLELPKKRNHQDIEEEKPEHLECPRCFSSNTKFCYYNNYNKSQPRHFCKSCKRHWTKGGTLRNVPLGGGRKNKRQKLSNSATNKNVSHVSSINYHSAPMSSNDPLVFSQKGDNNNGTSNNFIGNNTFLGGDHGLFFLATSQDQSKQFSCSEIDNNFGSNLPSFVPNNQSLHTYGYTQMPDSSIESTITTTMPMGGNNILTQKPWQDPFASGSMDLSSLWNWNEINSLVSADLNIPWDDEEIKF